ncbi:hypothetical protein DEO72_LG4g358 [Vigna unguiculata]|uniref:Uncharacterized protein n=1 Tax=Vigna unguiculata TaxID=3917 RepID=A0A4D6LN05_VIGUN|nr:hypothetical protein DEO72_LG4g358 [Vigna unguiculata]
MLISYGVHGSSLWNHRSVYQKHQFLCASQCLPRMNKGHKVLRATHPNLNKGHKVSSVSVNLIVLHHAHKGQSHQALDNRNHAHLPNHSNGDIPRRLLRLFSHRCHHVETAVGPVHHDHGIEHTVYTERSKWRQVRCLSVDEADYNYERDHQCGDQRIQPG